MKRTADRSLRVAVLSVVAFIALVLPAPAIAQTMTRCASCHFANLVDVPAPERLGEWQRSAHAKHAVGCDKCHGGDPWTYESTMAHRGVVGAANPVSPVHPANLAQTCGQCHRRNALAFSTSLHYTLAQADERRAPTCATCHGAMRAQVPSPETLEARCVSCHPEGSARGEYPALMRKRLESLNALRARADALDDAVAAVQEHTRRVELLVKLYDARTKLKETIASVHTFDLNALNAQIAIAQREIDAVAAAAAASVIER